MYSQENRHCARNAAHPTSENGKLAALTSGRPAFQQHTKRTEGSDTTHASHTRKGPERRAYKPQFRQKRKKITQPSGAATPQNSDAHERIAVPKAFYVLLEYIRPRPKSGKVRRSDTRPGDFRERAVRVEGSDSAPIRNAPCFAV